MKISVVGAGLAGLLAANMLRRHNVTVYEKQTSLPNNHHAVLRFRTPDVGNVIGVQFKKVNMIKSYLSYYNNIVANSLSYSKKTNGYYISDRSITSGTVISERYVAPPDLIEIMSDKIDIRYGENFNFTSDIKGPVISTIPMPVLMQALGYECNETFKSTKGIVATAKIENCDSYASILIPGPGIVSRATITGDTLMIECSDSKKITDHDLDIVIHNLGIEFHDVSKFEFSEQKYFKITEINESVRHNFMKYATVNFGIYSLGRFACWRPKLLLDDVVHDVRKIEQWITAGGLK